MLVLADRAPTRRRLPARGGDVFVAAPCWHAPCSVGPRVGLTAAETLWGRTALTEVCSSPSPPCYRPPLAASPTCLACICHTHTHSSPRPRPVGRRVAAAPACARRRPPRRRRRRPSAAGACAWRRGWGAWGARARVRRAVRGRPCVSATPPPRPQRQRGRAARLNRNPLRHVVAPRRSQRARRGRPERRHAAPGLAASATSMAAPAGPVPALVTSAAAPAASPAVAAA